MATKKTEEAVPLPALNALPRNPIDNTWTHRIVNQYMKLKPQREIAKTLKLDLSYVRAVLHFYNLKS